jgi:acyl-CoA thioester hydrolase
MPLEHTLEFRVSYYETDGQARVRHAQYLNYFERGRVELMRSLGHSYRNFEAAGLMLVVSEMNVRYLGAAQFDDILSLTTRVLEARGATIRHGYKLVRSDDGSPIVEAESRIACVDRQGRVRRLPDYLRVV